MIYNMKVQIEDPKTEMGMVSGLVLILRAVFSKADGQYGNKHFLKITGTSGWEPQVFDLRYDQTFDEDNKEKWLREWAHSYWSGKNGAWALKALTITKEQPEIAQ